MLHREVSANLSAPVCPSCGGKLSNERGLLVCAQHGSFFAYGPHLLVRAPHKGSEERGVPMPWENAERTRIR
jgi:hypothetical protein